MTTTINIWDDHTRSARDWKRHIEKLLGDPDIRVRAFEIDEIDHELHVLHKRREAFLRGIVEPDDPSALDDTCVLIVDNDLFHLQDFSDFSAETVAMRAGVYTDCGLIVVLNLNPDIDFDLTLRGDPDSKADLHVNDKFIANPGLWQQCPRENGCFRPWHWPLLIREAQLHDRRVDDLHRALRDQDSSTPILEYLQFPDEAKNRLSRVARAFLHPRRTDTGNISFSNFVDGNAQAVALNDGKMITQREDIKKVARIGARRVYKWLLRHIVGPQDILIDFPHLLQKLPFLIPEHQQASIEHWNSVASLDNAPVSLVRDALSIDPLRLPSWTDRPLFWSHDFERPDVLDRILAGIDLNPEAFVFCEDSSAFHPSDLSHRFVAAHNTASDDRFVRWLLDAENIHFGPQSRLAI